MTKTASHSTIRTCFVSAGGKVNLEALKSILADNSVVLVAPGGESKTGLTAFNTTATAIKQADFVVGILTGESGDHNVIFELGFAHALKKPLAPVAPQDIRIPSDLHSVLFIPNGLSNPEGLRFNIEQFLSAGAARKREVPHDWSGLETPSRNLGPDHSSSGMALEQKVADLFRSSGGSVVSESQQPVAGADLAIWLADLAPLVGNPILVEVKKEIPSSQSARRAVEQAGRFLRQSGARLVLIVYENGPSSEKFNLELASPVVLFFRLKEFARDVQAYGAAAVIRRLRNRLVHGAG